MTELSDVVSSAISGSSVDLANRKASEVGREMGKQEGLQLRINNIETRLGKIGSSEKVVNKATNFYRRQAEKQEMKLRVYEKKARREMNAAAHIQEVADAQANTAMMLQAKIARRVTSASQAENMQAYADSHGWRVFVGSKDEPRGWFDRLVSMPWEKLRLKYNEVLSRINSERAEGRLDNARAYKVSADSIRTVAKATRQAVENNASAYTESSEKREEKLQKTEGNLSGKLEISKDKEEKARQQMEFARGSMANMASVASETALESQKPEETAGQFYKKASEGLDAAGNVTGSAGNV